VQIACRSSPWSRGKTIPNYASLIIVVVLFQRPLGPEQRPTEWIVRSATGYVNNPATELPIEQGVRPDLPQFTSPHLEPSFLINLHAILLGRTALEIAEDFQNGRFGAERTIRRVAHAIPIPHEHSVQLYVCSDELCKLLVATEEQRVTEIAHQWHILLGPRPQPYESETDSRCQIRAWILSQLVTLAREALRSDRKIMIRLEYRQHRRDADTGTVRKSEPTRH